MFKDALNIGGTNLTEIRKSRLVRKSPSSSGLPPTYLPNLIESSYRSVSLPLLRRCSCDSRRYQTSLYFSANFLFHIREIAPMGPFLELYSWASSSRAIRNWMDSPLGNRKWRSALISRTRQAFFVPSSISDLGGISRLFHKVQFAENTCYRSPSIVKEH